MALFFCKEQSFFYCRSVWTASKNIVCDTILPELFVLCPIIYKALFKKMTVKKVSKQRTIVDGQRKAGFGQKAPGYDFRGLFVAVKKIY